VEQEIQSANTNSSTVAITTEGSHDEDRTVISVKEYRKLLGDEISSDGDILKRLQHLEALCRYMIREELKNYVGA